MKRTAAFLTAAVCAVACSAAYAMYSVSNEGKWPKNWPAELEPLRKQSRSLTGSLANLTSHEIPFKKREDFESAWPHILKVKSKGAPVVLLSGPNAKFGMRIDAGVRIHVPPLPPKNGVTPLAPTPHVTSLRERWLWTTYIELIVDGDVVDLNRIALPADTPIVDQRSGRGGGRRGN